MASLRRKVATQMAALMCCLLFVGGAALWGLEALRSDFGSALTGYQNLRVLYEIGAHVETAQTFAMIQPPQIAQARLELQKAMQIFELDLGQGTGSDEKLLHDSLSAALSADDVESAIETIYQPLVELDARNRQIIESAQKHADEKRQAAIIWMASLLVAAALVAALVGIAQYRSVVIPLWNLKNAVKTIAAGQFSQRVQARGAAEFVDLANQFNQMAAQLEASYRDLEQKVEAKSRELVRNERLASVGFLAAGVAHEINNPLGIMTAHAELALAALDRGDANAFQECQRTLTVVCEEAFRCKRIVEKLLTLARSPQEPPTAFSLGQLAAETAQAVAAMPEYQQRKLAWEIAPASDRVLARCGEVRQVILNLLSNALEATEAGGDVRLSVTSSSGKVILAVADSGRGISAETKEKIFEPFFTDRRGKAGTGLGLAITHAIVTRYGGQIEAKSDGVGKGSQLIVTFDQATQA